MKILKIEYGYCACGCGKKTKLFDTGFSEGEPMPYIKGHQPLANKMSNIDFFKIKNKLNS